MLRSSPSRALVSDDLPTLGLPTTAMWGRCFSLASSTMRLSAGSFSSTASSSSPVPLPVADEREKGSPSPSELNSYTPYIFSALSTLFTASSTGFLLRRKMSAISASKSVMPVPTSVMNITRSLSSMAIIT